MALWRHMFRERVKNHLFVESFENILNIRDRFSDEADDDISVRTIPSDFFNQVVEVKTDVVEVDANDREADDILVLLKI